MSIPEDTPRTALVTGCLGAIGQAICIELAAAGYRVVGMDRIEGAAFAQGSYLTCDLSDPASVDAAMQAYREGGGSVDLLVNNAGHYDPKPFFETSVEDFERSARINATAPFQLSQIVSRWMVEEGREGAIVNIASIAGKLGSPIVAYGASKAAVLGLTRGLAKALAPHGIRVNAVAPGVIRSPMSDAIAPEQVAAQLTVTAMKRLGEPEEIARVVVFLAGPGAAYMTGAVVDVAGGWMS